MNNFDLRKYLAEGRLKVNEGDMDHLMQDLERELKSHDWFYYMSDDPRTYDKGTNEQGELKRLLKMLNNSPEAVALYNRYAPVQDGIDLRIKEEKIEEAAGLPDDIEWEFDGVIDQMDAYNATIALTGHSESTGKNYTASAEASRGGSGGDWDWMEVDEVEEETVAEEKRPDYPDVDKDGDTEESTEKALKDKEAFKEGDYDPDQEQLDDEDEIFMPMDDEGRPLEEALNPEVVKAVNRLIKGLAKRYDYSEQDAVYAIMAALKQRKFDGLNEGYYGSSDIDNIASTLGYDDIDSFFNDNPGAVDAIMQWAETVPDFGRMLQDAGMIEEDLDLGHEDDEPGMLKGDLYKIGNYAMELYQMMDDLEGIHGEVDLPHWWQSKITTAKNMISGAKHYLEFELKEPAIDSMVSEAAPEEEDEFHRELDKLVHKTFGHSSDEKKEMKEYMSLEDQAKVYFMQKVKRGEIDELPEDPKAAFLAQMTKDQMDHDRETLDREGGLGEASFYTKNVKDKVISKLMDQLKK